MSQTSQILNKYLLLKILAILPCLKMVFIFLIKNDKSYENKLRNQSCSSLDGDFKMIFWEKAMAYPFFFSNNIQCKSSTNATGKKNKIVHQKMQLDA